MNKYDRELQLAVLETLSEFFPYPVNEAEERILMESFQSPQQFRANVIYLEMHGLITDAFTRIEDISGNVDYLFNRTRCRITEKGIDFLLNDGGLSAILNVQTIKFHDSTIIALEDIIRVANVPDEEKSTLISKLRELPADAIKHLTNELLTKAVLAAPAAIPVIQKFLHLG
ncbi:hypothetical protein [Vibrio sp.]|uniref:hypothetical protein n=1 Tax=Vibrio sp. TaxID=678 RepID=UPI003AA977FA